MWKLDSNQECTYDPCMIHILNLILNDRLKDMSIFAKRVRDVVRYVRNSPARLRKFEVLLLELSPSLPYHLMCPLGGISLI